MGANVFRRPHTQRDPLGMSAQVDMKEAASRFSNSHRPSSEGTFHINASECTPIHVDRG
jgi:hypothetical protein